MGNMSGITSNQEILTTQRAGSSTGATKCLQYGCDVLCGTDAGGSTTIFILRIGWLQTKWADPDASPYGVDLFQH